MATTGTVRTAGIEEELLLIDPQTRAISSRSRAALKANRDLARERERDGRGPGRASDELDLSVAEALHAVVDDLVVRSEEAWIPGRCRGSEPAPTGERHRHG